MPEPLSISSPPFEYNLALASSRKEELDKLRQLYSLEDPDLIVDYLNQHKELVGLLLNAVKPLRAAFGPEPVLKLRITADEESDGLYATVLWDGSSEEVRSRRDDFDRTWWLDNSRSAGGNLVIDYEYI